MASGAHRYKVALAACYRSPYSQLAANGGSIDLSYQFPVSRRYDLTVGSSYGFVHYRALGNFAAPDLADQIDAGYEEYYDIDKTLFDVYVAMSKRINWSKTLWAQPFLGLGFRYKWVKQTGRSHPEDPFAGPDLNGLMLRDHISDFGVPTLRFGLLIGFRLGH